MGLRAGFRRRIIRILERNLSVHRMGIRYKIKERKPARRSAGFRNPASKNVLTYLGSTDLQSAAKKYAFPFVGGLQIPRFLIGRTFFYGGVANPPGRKVGIWM